MEKNDNKQNKYITPVPPEEKKLTKHMYNII
jgi:hypothetical protein